MTEPTIDKESRARAAFAWSTKTGVPDAEMSFALSDGLLKKNGSVSFPAEAVAQQYARWAASGPGGDSAAWRYALVQGGASQATAAKVMARAAQHNAKSKASGVLARQVPLCIATSRNFKETVDHARRDALLTHPNPSCVNACIAYCVALAHLIEHEGDVQGATSKAIATASSVPGGDDDVGSWVLLEDPGDVASNDPGHARHACALTFWHLRRGSTVEEAFADVQSRGGSCWEVNASIVCAMLGALHGTLPADCVENPFRPASYKPARIPELVKKLLA